MTQYVQWGAQWGDKLDFLYEIRDSGMSPPALENKPELFGWMQEYLTGFYVLNRTRTFGFAPNPISLSEILGYIDLFGASDPGCFVEYMLKMDEAFLTIKAEIAKQRSKDKPDGK